MQEALHALEHVIPGHVPCYLSGQLHKSGVRIGAVEGQQGTYRDTRVARTLHSKRIGDTGSWYRLLTISSSARVSTRRRPPMVRNLPAIDPSAWYPDTQNSVLPKAL
eukprot:2294626-Rhodomonas_salina.1